MSTVPVLPGFSLTNRCLLYTSSVLAIPQMQAGLESHIPINIGFLAYNWYNQIVWYNGIKAKQLHALCLLLPHINHTLTLTYFGGVTAADGYTIALLLLGTLGLVLLNTVAAWTSWATNQREGFGVYEFFFFGWRTLGPHWHIFFLLWQISCTIEVIVLVTMAFDMIIVQVKAQRKTDLKPQAWCEIYPYFLTEAIWVGLLILWTELIVARNHIESATDWIAVWLFVAQVGALLIPFERIFLKCLRREIRAPLSLSNIRKLLSASHRRYAIARSFLAVAAPVAASTSAPMSGLVAAKNSEGSIVTSSTLTKPERVHLYPGRWVSELRLMSEAELIFSRQKIREDKQVASNVFAILNFEDTRSGNHSPSFINRRMK